MTNYEPIERSGGGKLQTDGGEDTFVIDDIVDVEDDIPGLLRPVPFNCQPVMTAQPIILGEKQCVKAADVMTNPVIV